MEEAAATQQPKRRGRKKGSKNKKGTKASRSRVPKLRTPEEKVKYYAARGWSLSEIAPLFDLDNDQAMLDWFWERPALRKAYEAGLWQLRTGEIEVAMAKRASGYDVTEITIYYKTDPTTGLRKEISRKESSRHIPADHKAGQFALVNKSKAWKGAETEQVGIIMHKAEQIRKPKDAGMSKQTEPPAPAK